MVNREKGKGMSSQPSSAGKKPRSPIEKVIVRGGILVLVVLVFVELRAQQGHSGTVSTLQELTANAEDDVPFSKVQEAVSWFPSTEVTKLSESETKYRYNWQSVFKPGRFVLNVVTNNEEPPLVLRYFTDDKDPMEAVPEENPMPALTEEEAAKALSGGGGGGGGARRQQDEDESGDSEERSRPPADDSESEEGAGTQDSGDESPEADPGTQGDESPADESSDEPATDGAAESTESTESTGDGGNEEASEPEAGSDEQ